MSDIPLFDELQSQTNMKSPDAASRTNTWRISAGQSMVSDTKLKKIYCKRRDVSVTNRVAMTYILPPLNALRAFCGVRPRVRLQCIAGSGWRASDKVDRIMRRIGLYKRRNRRQEP
jgi:hypothetical protein